MRHRMLTLGAAALLAVLVTTDLSACGDKFLMASRGTRYQRPKNFRAAAVLIYTQPADGLTSAKIESMLKSEGHRYTTVQSFEQLSTMLAGARFDVVLTGATGSPAVQRLVSTAPDAAVVVALDTKPKEGAVLKAIDKAVQQRDKNLKRLQASS
ncbi:MAG: hypothetical protein ABIS06_04425 [Vicinamibacterales bacterium]